MTLAPALAHSRASADPKPPPAPVIRMTRPARRLGSALNCLGIMQQLHHDWRAAPSSRRAAYPLTDAARAAAPRSVAGGRAPPGPAGGADGRVAPAAAPARPCRSSPRLGRAIGRGSREDAVAAPPPRDRRCPRPPPEAHRPRTAPARRAPRAGNRGLPWTILRPRRLLRYSAAEPSRRESRRQAGRQAPRDGPTKH